MGKVIRNLIQIEKEILGLDQDASIEQVKELIGRYVDCWGNLLPGIQVKEQYLLNISKKLSKRWSNFSYFHEIIDYLFVRLKRTPSIYPYCFETEKDSLTSEPCFNLVQLMTEEASIFTSFALYTLFMEMMGQLHDLNLLKDLIQKIPEPEKDEQLNLKRVIFYCFKNTEKIPWDQKRELFWKWKQNPIFEFWQNKNINEIISVFISGFKEFLSDCTNELLFHKHKNLYKPYILLMDSYLILKNIPELKEEVKKRNTAFGRIEKYINELSEKCYHNFLEIEKIEKLFPLLTRADEWNASIRGLFRIKNRENKKKLEELTKVMMLFDSVPEIKKNIKEIKFTESPDFIIITQDGKKIALELTAIDLSEEVKMDRKGETPFIQTFPLDLSPKNPVIEIPLRIEEATERKTKKYNTKAYDENWLLLYPLSTSLSTEAILWKRLEKDLKNFEDFKKYCNFDFIKKKYGEIFQRIFVMILEEIIEINTGKEYKLKYGIILK